MRAIAIKQFGGADVLSEIQVEAPTPGPGQVAIDVAFAGVNFAEVMYRRGLVPVELPYVPGIEVSGHIRSIGAGVTGFQIGEPVAGLSIINSGGYAEVVVVDARLVAPIPGNPGHAQLATYAATPSNSVTAFLIAEHVARLRREDSVLVHAAAGGFGSQLGQVGRLLGIEALVGTVGSAAKIEQALSFGYTAVVPRDNLHFHPESVVPEGGFDVVVDPVGGPHRTDGLEMLAPGGHLVAMGNASGGDDVAISANELWFASVGISGHSTLKFAKRRPDLVGNTLRRAVHHVAACDLHVAVGAIFALSEAVEAHRHIETGMTTGKLVLDTGA